MIYYSVETKILNEWKGVLRLFELVVWIYRDNNRGRDESKKYIDTKQSNKKNNQNSKDKRQDYNMK